MAIIEDTPDTMLRSDLWHEMTVDELSKQQDLMIDKINKLQSLVGMNASPSVLAMYSAMQLGFTDLINILNTKTSKEL